MGDGGDGGGADAPGDAPAGGQPAQGAAPDSGGAAQALDADASSAPGGSNGGPVSSDAATGSGSGDAGAAAGPAAGGGAGRQPSPAPAAGGARRGDRRLSSLRRRLIDVLRGNIEVEVEVQEGDSDEDADDEGDAAEGAGGGADGGNGGGAGEEEPEFEGASGNVVVLGTREDNEDNSSESHSDVDLPTFREQLSVGDEVAVTLWRSAVFRNPAELTGECALAVARWVERGIRKPAQLDDEMILCIIRCLERGYAMFEEEEDLVSVFTAAVGLTEAPECVDRMLERGALRAMVRGLQSSAHLLRDPIEDADWFENERLARIYRAFKTLWRACCARPEDEPKRKCITNLVFTALGKWLRGVPLQDVWIGEDDILVFWVLIPLWPDYLDHLQALPTEKSAEERGRFKEICNWVLWPNDPVVESGYRLIGHLDLPEAADFSLAFLLSEERFRWIITPATKQRYLQYRVGEVASERAAEAGAAGGGEQDDGKEEGLVLVVNRETPLQDLCRQLGVSGYRSQQDKPPNLLGGITVHFRDNTGDEEAIDEGGPWREAIPLMFSELLSPNHGLFEMREDDEARTVEPRWCAPQLVPDYQAQFELCGMLVGMALLYQAYAPAHFSRSFLKHLIGLPRTLDDAPGLREQLSAIEAAAAAGDEALEALCLTFSVDDATTGRTVELLPEGASIPVAAARASEYAKLRTEWELEGRFAPVMPHVHKGLHAVVPPEALKAFARTVTAEELDVLLAGHGINIEDWREHTEYYGYEESSNVIKWFWDAVEGFTAQEREDLWTFISGSKGVPPGGFGNLTNAAGEAIRFTIAKVEASPSHLPVAHTCGYQLDLAQYATAEDLANKLRAAMSHRQGFGLA